MKKKTCGKGVTLSADHALCKRPNGSKCEHKCGGGKDSVCGTDGRTYLNRCMLQVEICRLGIALFHVGPCNNISAHRENCPKDCKLAPQDGPVCGSDGNVYKRILPNNTPLSGILCWGNAKPACGSDGKVYATVCRIKSKNCGKHVFKVPMAYCASQERTSYSLSECELKLSNCGNNRRVVKVDLEKCRGRLAKCIKTKCPKDFDPVCGTDARTYTNQCQLNLATCLKSVQFVHVVNCTKLKEQEPCPTSCENETGDEPVCESDGNVYRSNCHLKKETCGQLVIEVPLHHCRTTASCNEKCTDDRNFVCGSDNKINRSECEMKGDNCGKHIYVVPIKRCLAEFQFKGGQKMYPTYYDPVCETDGMTYSINCFLDMESCRSRSLVRMKHMGTCAEPINEIHKNYLY
ncbi:hypothetical protein JTB14_028628 [Gonioctena quinquepunctata]|nr:hypothetical protein JTB14_028628 [Gonioctena quinquepunctata]